MKRENAHYFVFRILGLPESEHRRFAVRFLFLDHLTDLNAARVDHRDSALCETAEPPGDRVLCDEPPKASVMLANNWELGERVPKREREHLINAILGANCKYRPTEPSPDRDGVHQPFEDVLEPVDGLLRHLNRIAVLDASLVREKVSDFRVQVEIVGVIAPVWVAFQGIAEELVKRGFCRPVVD